MQYNHSIEITKPNVGNFPNITESSVLTCLAILGAKQLTTFFPEAYANLLRIYNTVTDMEYDR